MGLFVKYRLGGRGGGGHVRLKNLKSAESRI